MSKRKTESEEIEIIKWDFGGYEDGILFLKLSLLFSRNAGHWGTELSFP